MAPNLFKLRAVLREIDEHGIKVGDLVSVSWPYVVDGEPGESTHVGILRELNRETGRFELNPSGSSPGHLKSTLLVSSVMVPAKLSPLDFKPFKGEQKESGTTDSKTATENPFVAKARKAAMSKKPRERTVKEHALFKPNPFLEKVKKS